MSNIFLKIHDTIGQISSISNVLMNFKKRSMLQTSAGSFLIFSSSLLVNGNAIKKTTSVLCCNKCKATVSHINNNYLQAVADSGAQSNVRCHDAYSEAGLSITELLYKQFSLTAANKSPIHIEGTFNTCLLYTSPSPRD